jgi:superfamily II DNA or RNA helicase
MDVLHAFNCSKTFIGDKIKEINAIGNVIAVDDNLYTDINVHKMKANQRTVYDKYCYTQYLVIMEPPGSGKSTTIKFVSTKRLLNDKDHKIIIAIPQTLIAKSFGKVMLEYPDGERYEWDMGSNLCDRINYSSKTKTIIRFLKKKKFSEGLHNRVLITTHMAIARASDKLEKIGDEFKNTTLIIDEAHHILSPENGDSKSANKVGSLIHRLMLREDPTTSIWLITATFFRGDQGSIIGKNEISKFERYFLPLDKHWRENIQYIQSFEFNFVVYDKIIESVTKILKERRKKTIIYCPYTGHLLKNRSKLQFRDQLITAIKKIWPDCNVIDLIDINGRDSRKALLFDEENAKDIDIILSVRIFDEGSDWVYAEQVLDLVPSNSLRIQVQRIGRIWRDTPNKNHISYYTFLPHMSKFETEEDQRMYFTNNNNALTASMLLYESIEPIKYPSKSGIKEVNPFELVVPDESIRQVILNEVIKRLVIFRSIKKHPTTTETKNKIQEVLSKYNIEDKDDLVKVHIALLLKRLTRMHTARGPNYETENFDIKWIAEAGYDEIFKKDIYEGLLIFGTHANGVSTYEQFREIYSGTTTVEEWVAIAEELAKKNDGVLYKNSKLINMKLSGLVSCMYMYPEKFAHIQQETKLPRNINFIGDEDFDPSQELEDIEYLLVAKKLESLNDGVIPPMTWLISNKYIGLVIAIRNNPKIFEGMKQYGERNEITTLGISNDIKKAKKYLKLAKELETKYGQLRKRDLEKYKTLTTYIQKYPAVFQDIKQEN